jgi:hypothetical protein
LRLAEGVITTTGTSKLEATLADFGFEIGSHAIKTHSVLVFRTASDDLVGSILVIASNTAERLADEAGAKKEEE